VESIHSIANFARIGPTKRKTLCEYNEDEEGETSVIEPKRVHVLII